MTYIQYDAADLTLNLYGPDHDDGIYMISTNQGNWKIWSVKKGWILSFSLFALHPGATVTREQFQVKGT